MTPGFYQKYWKAVGSDIIDLVIDFFCTALLPRLNYTNMVLIPRKKNPSSMGDLRPIDLCKVVWELA